MFVFGWQRIFFHAVLGGMVEKQMGAVEGKEVAPGTYQLAWAAQKPGIHDVALQFKRGTDTFTWQEHVEALR